MPVTLYCNQLFQNRQELYQFLFNCQQIACEKQTGQIVSIATTIEPVDPLVIFHALAHSQQLNFYFEKQTLANQIAPTGPHVAIAAIDSAIQFTVEHSDRFEAVKHFIQTTLGNSILAGNLHEPFAGPHFFASFTFATHPPQTAAQPFPGATVFLPRWQVTRHPTGCTLVANLPIHPTTAIAPLVEQTWATLQQIKSLRQPFLSPPAAPPAWLNKTEHDHHFQTAVQAALASIHNQTFDKIVLSHAIDIAAPLPFNHTASLHNLRRLYPDCYIFSVSNGQGVSFIGASPERLVSLNQRQLLTDALAGSAPRGASPTDDARLANRLLNSPKEMHEHQVVLDFILGQLAQLGMQPAALPLRLLQLSNIQHLHTPIQATVPPHVHLLDIVATLHPTPAVAGMPRTIACEQIQQYEPWARSLYAAPIGWVNYAGDGEFAVGIRSAFVQGNQARLFAGAGIVAGSDPTRELAEVKLKLQALLSALA